MIKALKYILVGFIFGIILVKSEAASWYRIYEMFHFQAFQMYGIIGTAIAVGLIGIQFIKKNNAKDIKGNPIVIADKEPGSYRYWIGGVFFGLGWALVGACPGPIFILIGAGYLPVVFILAGALIGTFIYGMVKDYLPHGYYRKHLNK